MLPYLIAVSSLFNSSFQKELSLSSCREVEVKKKCALVVDADGFGTKPFVVYNVKLSGEMVPLRIDRLDRTGTKKVTLSFDDQGTKSLVVVLFDNNNPNMPVAMDGTDVLVVPDKNQLGEQTDLVFPSSTEENYDDFNR